MSDDKKPREWRCYLDPETGLADVESLGSEDGLDTFKVIEHSAFAALEKERDELSGFLEDRNWDWDQIEAENAELKRQLADVQTLEMAVHTLSVTNTDLEAELKAAREEIQNLKDGEWPIELSEAGGEIDRLNARLTEAREVLTYHGPNTMPLTYGPYMGGAAQPLIQDYSPALGQITNELKEIKKLLELIGTRIG